jgi:AcrR family transcriptional regulator/DNA-binding MarR family transcriptional regulator
MRILSALVEVVCERGAGAATVAHVVARAGVSRRTFYELFHDRHDCLQAAFEEAVAQAGKRIGEAWESQEKWVDRVRAALLAGLVFMDEEPQLARLCVVESASCGPELLARRAELLAKLARGIDMGRDASRRGEEPPPLTAEGVIGAVSSVIHIRLLEPNAPLATELLGSLMSMIVLPYLGPAAARREFNRKPPAIPKPPARTAKVSDPLEGLDMRLTYRTLRVLNVIASQPGVSNRDVADQAGITDQGQMSRLLARLENLGLSKNTGEGHTRGATNAWHLTQKGREIQHAINPSAS